MICDWNMTLFVEIDVNSLPCLIVENSLLQILENFSLVLAFFVNTKNIVLS